MPIITEDTTFGLAGFAEDRLWVITQNVTVSAPSIGLLTTARADVRIDGTIAAPLQAISLNFLAGSSSAGSTIGVGSQGALIAVTNAAVFCSTADITIENDGYVAGAQGLRFTSAIGAEVHNSGTIVGLPAVGSGLPAFGILMNNATAQTYIHNEGTISGAAAIAVSGSIRIVNDGSLVGRSEVYYAIGLTGTGEGVSVLRLKNDGSITGAGGGVTVVNATAIITNTGEITGNVTLASGNDVFLGGRGLLDGFLRGNGGKDELRAGLGDDDVNGGPGDDKIWGNAGDDLLLGGDGADTIHGGVGDDDMSGGLGADVFVFGRDHGLDMVVGFQNGIDKLDLRALNLPGFAAIAAQARNTDAGLVINLDPFGGDRLLLDRFTRAQFDATDVLI